MSNYRDDWTGTQKELHNVIDYMIEKLHEECELELSQKDMNRLFLEALTRNTVIEELKNAINNIHSEE